MISKRKRKAASDEEKRDKYCDKIARVMLTLIVHDFDEINTIE